MNTASIPTSMGDIADSGSVPIRKSDIPSIPLDDVSTGNNLANVVIAHIRGDNNSWKSYAIELIGMHVTAREQFMKAIAEWLKDERKQHAAAMGTYDNKGESNPTKEETKRAGKRVSTMTNRVSVLNTVAKAFNSGADVVGLMVHYGETQQYTPEQRDRLTLEDVPLAVIYEYAQPFAGSKAGPKVKSWLVKLNKWLEENKGREDNDDDRIHRETVMSFVANIR